MLRGLGSQHPKLRYFSYGVFWLLSWFERFFMGFLSSEGSHGVLSGAVRGFAKSSCLFGRRTVMRGESGCARGLMRVLY